MKIKMIAALAAIAVASPALASGGGGGGGGGGFGGGFGGAPRVKISPEQRSFQRGQRIFRKSVACKECAYPRGVTSTKQAQDIVTKVKSGQIKVKKNRQRDLLYYLSQRYRVKA